MQRWAAFIIIKSVKNGDKKQPVIEQMFAYIIWLCYNQVNLLIEHIFFSDHLLERILAVYLNSALDQLQRISIDMGKRASI
jgi:hypothetical protein